ncbi:MULTISPECIES: hypothetical protein [unclassified Shinella]|uniref:hypothetical protein n=1 Tax=unclassified Shinella TaxID=2643062 RepID=UPI00225DA3E3|nr:MULTISPECIES: hypothetical protein [unclassified Shinella]MCO5138979.1 hypothetical protein [Shinella sp.]MDC7256292.1 hypothetical protein [Shinella sp. YE25]CAI0339151.1 conserved hypothetical protein [Rhizobiaceae bacterium]CAK7257564.1 conserved protein of unknown function [Shinella sp. WSC3-e]
MFLEKHSRFIRRYEFTLGARKKLGAVIPLYAEEGELSLYDALDAALEKDGASAKQPNNDTVDLAEMDWIGGCLVLLFHRSSPDAADPMYRRFVKGKRQLRPSVKEDDEEQTVSAHMVIKPHPVIANTYKFALEEIPGLSASTIIPIIRQALAEYAYEYEDKRGETHETYATLKYEGIKSESLEEALKTGRFIDIKISRPAEIDFLDAEGVIAPGREYATLKITAELDEKELMDRLVFWRNQAAANGWTDFSVDLEMDDKRRRTVRIDRDAEAKEILFVRADQVNFRTELKVCAAEIVEEFVSKSIELLEGK